MQFLANRASASHDALRLRAALRDHHAVIRRNLFGVSDLELSSETARWLALGDRIADLALQIGETCQASVFYPRRLNARLIAQLLAEAIDGQIDLDAWSVIEAAACARAGGHHG